MTAAPANFSEPEAGSVVTVKLVNGFDSRSLYWVENKAEVKETLVSSRPATATAPSTGASFTATTEMVTVSTPESTVPSFTLKVKLSEPEKLRLGV